MERAKQYTMYVLVGTAAYWIPDILIRWVRPTHFLWIALLTFFVPAVVGRVWFLLSRRPSHSRFRVGLPLFMLLGIWMFGPLAIAIGTIPTGAKFLETGQIGGFFMMWAAFPVSTFMMSTYSGSLGGLVLSTLLLLIAAIFSAVRGKISS